ncbi:MAG: AAA family ATPase [Candidatus Micrarchaeales archaeon]|jgi:cell division control protein 6
MDDKFAGLFKESKIFTNREILSPHYLPEHLLFRDKQLDDVVKALTPSLKGERGRNIFIYGNTGTGKTSCMKHVIDEVRKLPIVKARISYINCRIYNSRYRVLSKIVSDHLPFLAKRGYGLVEIYEKIISWIEEDGKVLIVVLDEIDIVKDLDDLVYTLTRANSDLRSGGITIVGISNKISFKESLDPRSLSTLYEHELVFPPYNSNELAAILKERAANGFKHGVIAPETISLAAAIAAKESGDARLALKIISRAGEIAEEKERSIVGDAEVQEAQKDAEEDIAYEVISTLPEHQKLVLYSIAVLSLQGTRYKKLTDGNDTYLFSGEVYNKYTRLSGALSKEAKSSRWYRKYIADLEMQGLITTYESGKGIRGHTKLIKLAYSAEKIKETIEKNLFMDGEGKGEAAAAQASS